MEKDKTPSSESKTSSHLPNFEEAATAPGTAPPSNEVEHTAPLRPLEPTDLPFVKREHYVIEGEHARGGLGRILQGWDRRLDRPVAIKELLIPNSQAQARFIREALVSARLQHPAIVPVYEAGRWSDGEPFYAMKMINGRSLKEIIDEAQSLDQRLALVPHILAVADAMAYAHEQRVIHRDLKPSNVLVGRFGETVVIDWGLAKDLTGTDQTGDFWDSTYRSANLDLTNVGVVMGTPQYMAPEQGSGETVDERADVYAIGAMLYHVLAGTTAYTGSDSEAVLEQLRAGPPLPLEHRQPGVPKELVAIVHKAMARLREERYPSARELAEDLRRFQTGQLVAAHEYSRWTLFHRWLRRYHLPVGIAGIALVILAIGSVLAFQRILYERNDAIVARARSWLERDPTTTVAILKTHPEGSDNLSERREVALIAQEIGVARHIFRGNPWSICLGDFSPDGKLFASSGSGRTLVIWDVSTGQEIHRWPVQYPIFTIRFSSDGQTIAYIGTHTRHITLHNLRTSKERQLAIEGQGLVKNIAFSPKGNWVIAITDTNSLYLWPILQNSPPCTRTSRPHQ